MTRLSRQVLAAFALLTLGGSIHAYRDGELVMAVAFALLSYVLCMLALSEVARGH